MLYSCVATTPKVILVVKLSLLVLVFVLFFHLLFEQIVASRKDQEKRRPSFEERSSWITDIIEDKYNKTMSNKSNLLSSDRNLLLITAEGTTLEDFVQYLLLLHPQVIHLGSLADILEGWYLSRSADDIDKVLDWLNTCHTNILSVFVDYANALLVSTDVPRWCSTKRIKSKQSKSPYHGLAFLKSRYYKSRSTVYCIPPPRAIFRQMCTSHHIAIDVTSVTELFVPVNAGRHRNVKLVRMAGTNCMGEFCYVDDNRTKLASNDDYIPKTINTFVRCDNGPNFPLKFCMLELFNYIDTYLDFSFLNNIFNFIYS